VARELDDLLLRCLSRDPEDRPQQVGELAAALEALTDACPWSDEASRRWWVEHPIS
jgi:serine/threonine protein kinase